MNIISIDPSLRSTGIFTKIGSDERSFVIKTNEKIVCCRSFIYNQIKSILEKEKFDMAIVEGYAINTKHGKSIIPAGEIGGIVRLALEKKMVPFIEMPVQLWKHLTVNASKSNKKEYLGLVKNRFEKEFDTTDEADAFLFFQAARMILKTTKNLSPAMIRLKSLMKDILNLGDQYE